MSRNHRYCGCGNVMKGFDLCNGTDYCSSCYSKGVQESQRQRLEKHRKELETVNQDTIDYKKMGAKHASDLRDPRPPINASQAQRDQYMEGYYDRRHEMQG